MFSSMWWRVTVPFVVILLAATLGLTLYLSAEIRTARLDDLSDRLVDAAILIADGLQPLLGHDTDVDLDTRTAQWSERLAQRVTLIAADGTVLADSHADSQAMENHLFRTEIQQALTRGTGTATRYSRTQRLEVMYAAATVTDGDTLLGFARVALPVAEIHANVNRLNRTLIIAGVVAALIATAVATVTASRTIRPVTRLTDAVERMAAGDLSRRLLPTTNDEVGKLTHAFNHLADQLQDKVTHLALERARLATVLEQMADGVVITDNSGTITMINTAAARILKYDEEQAVGRRFPQVAYSYQLIDLWNRCYETQEEQSAIVETALYADFVRAVVTPLHRRISPPSGSLDEDPVHSAGALTTPRYLIMLQDLTHIRRLETIRRDFISNVSHELRTPLASLSLVVETLRDGALEDPPAARRFLDHMESELASLTQMVEELLELSRIESGRVPLELTPTKVRKLILKPVKRLRPQAERKGIALNLTIPDDLPRVQADAARVQQVVANLLHNAIKFTPTGGTITLSAQVCTPAKGRSPSAPQLPQHSGERSPRCRGEGQLTITVSDTGIGIPPDELQRIFERFYKTDRARAQEGTGLGLAISKHIIEVHGGQIWAESVEGAGSTFSFTLPIATSPSGDHD